MTQKIPWIRTIMEEYLDTIDMQIIFYLKCIKTNVNVSFHVSKHFLQWNPVEHNLFYDIDNTNLFSFSTISEIQKKVCWGQLLVANEFGHNSPVSFRKHISINIVS